LAIVERLLEAGADANADPGQENGASALQAAGTRNSLAIVERLLEAGAHVGADAGCDITDMMAAVYSGNLAIVERFLECGADVHTRSKNGSTAFLYVTRYECDNTVRERILQAGALRVSDSD
jgi:ankyrin repeat protein